MRTHAELLDEPADTVGFWDYLWSSHFGQGLMENWQSEYLQFFLFVGMTVWLIQRGSTDSKEPGKAGTEISSCCRGSPSR